MRISDVSSGVCSSVLHEGREPAAPPPPGLTSLPVLEWRDDRWWLAAGFLRAGRHAFRLDVVQRIAEGARNAEQAARQKPKREDAKPANKPAEPVVETLPPPIEDTAVAETAAAIEPVGEEIGRAHV